MRLQRRGEPLPTRATSNRALAEIFARERTLDNISNGFSSREIRDSFFILRTVAARRVSHQNEWWLRFARMISLIRNCCGTFVRLLPIFVQPWFVFRTAFDRYTSYRFACASIECWLSRINEWLNDRKCGRYPCLLIRNCCTTSVTLLPILIQSCFILRMTFQLYMKCILELRISSL